MSKNKEFEPNVIITCKTGYCVYGRLLKQREIWLVIENKIGNIELIAISGISHIELIETFTTKEMVELGLNITL